jgi:hypothetical protein
MLAKELRIQKADQKWPVFLIKILHHKQSPYQIPSATPYPLYQGEKRGKIIPLSIKEHKNSYSIISQ